MTLDKIIEKISKTSHGIEGLKELKQYLVGNYKKTNDAVIKFLKPTIIREPIKWVDIKDKVWKEKQDQDNNKFKFLQGDIIGTTKVLRLKMAESLQAHDLSVLEGVQGS